MARVSNLSAKHSNITFHFQTYTLPLGMEKAFCNGPFQGVEFITSNFTNLKGKHKLDLVIYYNESADAWSNLG